MLVSKAFHNKMRVSAEWCVAIEHQRLSSIRDYLC